MTRPKKPAAEPAGEKAAEETVAQPAPVKAANAAELPGDEIAPPADATIQSGQDGAGEADSSIPAATDPASPPFSAVGDDIVFPNTKLDILKGGEALPVAELQGADPLAVARSLVENEPTLELVEAVRRVLAGEFVPAQPTPVAPEDRREPRLGHRALMHLDRERTYEPGALVFVTEAEFDRLKAGHVFEGWWDEGVEEG